MNAPVAGAGHGDFLVLGPAVHIADEVFGAGFCPTYGPVEFSSQVSHHYFFFGGHAFGTETAADVFDKNAHLFWFKAERAGYCAAKIVGTLRRSPTGHAPVFPLGGRYPWLDRYRGYPGVHYVLGNNHVVVAEVNGVVHFVGKGNVVF